MKLLSPNELAVELRSIDVGWTNLPDHLVRVFETPNFKTGFGLVAHIAKLAEAADHHPEITLGYNKVEVRLTTHSEGGVTAKDIALARSIDQLDFDEA